MCMKGALLFVKASDSDWEKPAVELLGLLDYPELTDGGVAFEWHPQLQCAVE